MPPAETSLRNRPGGEKRNLRGTRAKPRFAIDKGKCGRGGRRLLSTGLEIPDQLASELSANDNAHIRALAIAAYVDQHIARRPPITLSSNLPTTDCNWLLNLVAKASGYTGANFSGALTVEFDHLAKKKIKLIDFEKHITAAQATQAHAISRTRYGYDSDDDNCDDGDDDDETIF